MEWFTHPLCQKCYIISLSQQIIEIFILYDWSHDHFKCLYYPVRRKQCCIVLYCCTIISLLQVSWPGRCCISYTDWPHWNTVNYLHYIHSDLWSKRSSVQYIRIYIYSLTLSFSHTHMHACTQMHTNARTHTHTHTHTHTYTHTHTQGPSSGLKKIAYSHF